MKRFLSMLLMVSAGCGFVLSCGKSAPTVVEKTDKPAQFTFLTPQELHLRLLIENVGDVRIKGSMPDTTVFQVHREAVAAGRTRASELMDRIAMVPTMEKDGMVKFQPKYPGIKSGEKVFTHVDVLVPLNQRISISLAVTGGNFEAAGLNADLTLKTVGKNQVTLQAFQGLVNLDLDSGEAVVGMTLEGGKIHMKDGRIIIKQRMKEPMNDLVVELDSGEVIVEVIQGFTGRIRLEAPEVKNTTPFKLAPSSEGKGILVKVKKGSAHLRSELF